MKQLEIKTACRHKIGSVSSILNMSGYLRGLRNVILTPPFCGGGRIFLIE